MSSGSAPPATSHDAAAVVAAFRRRFGRDPALVVRAPGRVSLLGGHVDYSEGLVLAAAIDRAVYLAASPRADRELRLVALDLGDEATLDLAALPPPVHERPPATLSWSDVPAAVAWSLRREGLDPGGLDAVFGGDLPMGSGVSSSAAVEMAFLLAWEDDPLRRGDAWGPRVGQRAENGYLGVGSGVMDQYASLHGRRDTALLLDCRTLEHRAIPVPPRCAVLVFDSGVRRRLAGSGFDDRRAECARAVEVLRQVLPGIRTLRDVDAAALARHAHLLPPPLRRRAEHTVGEIARVRQGAADLARGDLAAFGAAMRASHESSRDLHETSIRELDVLAAAAWEAPGCHGARLTGGGFGGSVVALVDAAAADAVTAAVAAEFARELGRRPTSFRCRLADGAARAADG